MWESWCVLELPSLAVASSQVTSCSISQVIDVLGKALTCEKATVDADLLPHLAREQTGAASID